jgi:hypothetical protein
VSTRITSRSRPGSSRTGAGFLKEDSGAYTIFAVIGFAMLMVVIGLVIDVGRVMNVHSQASSYADRIALTAAAELDGRPNALRSALTAARAIPIGERLTLSGNNDVGIQRLVFLSDLGVDPENPFARFGANPCSSRPSAGDRVTAVWRTGTPAPTRCPGVSANLADRETRYVMAETTPEKENYLFFPIAGALNPDIRTSATVAPQAVAGFKRELCNSAPVMVCNPDETGFGLNATFNAAAGRQFSVNLQSGVNWNSNNYSLLKVDSNVLSVNSTLLGVPLNIRLRNLLGRPNPGTACYANTVRPQSLLNLGLDLGLATPIGSLQAQVGDGFNDRYNSGEDFPVVVVNCRQNRVPLLLALLGLDVDVPIEAFARVRIVQAVAANLRLRLQIANRTRPTPGEEPDPLREYPVLVR